MTAAGLFGAGVTGIYVKVEEIRPRKLLMKQAFHLNPESYFCSTYVPQREGSLGSLL